MWTDQCELTMVNAPCATARRRGQRFEVFRARLPPGSQERRRRRHRRLIRRWGQTYRFIPMAI